MNRKGGAGESVDHVKCFTEMRVERLLLRRELKEMSMVYPKGTEGYALIEENLRR